LKLLKPCIIYIGCLLVCCLLTIPIEGKTDPKKGEWRFYGGDQGSTKYSPLDQINRNNVQKLKTAWIWDSPDLKILEANSKLYTLGYEATPLMRWCTLYQHLAQPGGSHQCRNRKNDLGV
jgi:glucose dehydrogenase